MASVSSVEILGGGPAGLYTAILLRRLMPQVRLRVTEQNPQGATFGFGVLLLAGSALWVLVGSAFLALAFREEVALALACTRLRHDDFDAELFRVLQ